MSPLDFDLTCSKLYPTFKQIKLTLAFYINLVLFYHQFYTSVFFWEWSILMSKSTYFYNIYYSWYFSCICSHYKPQNYFSWNNRIMDLHKKHRIIGIVRDLWRLSSPTPPLNQVLYTRIHRKASKWVLNTSRERDSNNNSGQLVPLLCHPQST